MTSFGIYTDHSRLAVPTTVVAVSLAIQAAEELSDTLREQTALLEWSGRRVKRRIREQQEQDKRTTWRFASASTAHPTV